MTFPRTSSSTISIARARILLGIPNDRGPPPSRELIQRRFLEAAKVHHPDSRHRPNSQPCPVTFRQCSEARSVLLEHYYGGGGGGAGSYASGSNGTASSSSYWKQSNTTNKKRRFGQGFPHRTLRVLSLKQNLALRGAIMVFLTVGTFYDEWGRRSNNRSGRSSASSSVGG